MISAPLAVLNVFGVRVCMAWHFCTAHASTMPTDGDVWLMRVWCACSRLAWSALSVLLVMRVGTCESVTPPPRPPPWCTNVLSSTTENSTTTKYRHDQHARTCMCAHAPIDCCNPLCPPTHTFPVQSTAASTTDAPVTTVIDSTASPSTSEVSLCGMQPLGHFRAFKYGRAFEWASAGTSRIGDQLENIDINA